MIEGDMSRMERRGDIDLNPQSEGINDIIHKAHMEALFPPKTDKYKTLLDKYERLLDSYVKLTNMFLERMDDENTL